MPYTTIAEKNSIYIFNFGWCILLFLSPFPLHLSVLWTHFVIFGRNRRNNMEKRRVFVCLFIFFLMWGIDILGSNAYEQIVSTGFFRNCRVMYDLTYLPNVRHKTPEKPGDGEFFYPLEVHSYLSPVLLYEKWNWGPGKFQQYFNIPRFIPLHNIYIV